MKTNLLAQNDSLVIENLKADVGRSVENLTHSVTFPIDVDGAILPICCIETLPSDSFEIIVECLLRQLSPLKVPLMTTLRLNTAFYYCDNRLAWKKWERFMTGGRSGNELYDIPRMANIVRVKSNNPDKYTLADITPNSGDIYFKGINYSNSLHTYFGISMNLDFSQSVPQYDDITDMSDELPIAFPFFDYQLICRDYYTNVDRLKQYHDSEFGKYQYDNIFADWAYDNLFPSDDDEIRLVDGPQVESGFKSGDDNSVNKKGFILDKVRYHDVRPDYFTTSKKAPMRGDAPTISEVSSSFTIPSGTEIKLQNTEGIIFRTDNSSSETPTSISLKDVVKVGDNIHKMDIKKGSQIGSTDDYSLIINDPSNYASTVKALQADVSQLTKIEGKTSSNISMSGSTSVGLTAADIRLLGQLTVWQELNMLHEPYYNDFLNAHFDNVRVGESPVEKPIYIGGTSQVISINEILQTSASSGSSYLGNQGATAMSLASNRVGTYYSNNYGYIIGVAYIVPDLLYKPAMPRGFSRRTKEDFYSPEFANLSMQATLNKEIFFSNDDDWNNSPWGYTGAFDELRSIPNRIAGDLLNPNYTDLQKWVLTREMANDNLPAMESTWLSLKGNVDPSAWQVTSMPKFMLQVANYIKAVRPMPKVAIPKAL